MRLIVHMKRHSRQEPLSRKDREKLARQQDILKAARELFITKGYRETTLEEIAHLAEFGKGTLYNYFANKDEIFRAMIDKAMGDAVLLAREAVAWPGGLREKLAHYALTMIGYIKDNGELLHVIALELHRGGKQENAQKVRDLLTRAQGVWEVLAVILQQGMDEGTIRRFDPAQYIILFDGMVRSYCFKKFSVDAAPSDEEYAQAAELIVSVFLDGITERKTKG